jgi:hypothetical protein
MADRRLPGQFSDLEPYAAKWCLATERERFAERMASSMEEMQAFYDAFFPRIEEAIAYCDGFPLDEMPEDALRLLQLVHSLVMVSFPIEVWRRPNVLDSADAYLDRILEPVP